MSQHWQAVVRTHGPDGYQENNRQELQDMRHTGLFCLWRQWGRRKRKGRKEDKREKYKNRKIEVKSFGEVIEAAETYWLFPSILVEHLRCNRFRGFNSQSNRAHLLGNTKPIDAHSLHLIKISFKHFLRGRLKSWNTHNFIRHFFRTRRMGFKAGERKKDSHLRRINKAQQCLRSLWSS